MILWVSTINPPSSIAKQLSVRDAIGGGVPLTVPCTVPLTVSLTVPLTIPLTAKTRHAHSTTLLLLNCYSAVCQQSRGYSTVYEKKNTDNIGVGHPFEGGHHSRRVAVHQA